MTQAEVREKKLIEQESFRIRLAQQNKDSANRMLLRMLELSGSSLASEVDSVTTGVCIYE